jgi:hypothetical protein
VVANQTIAAAAAAAAADAGAGGAAAAAAADAAAGSGGATVQSRMQSVIASIGTPNGTLRTSTGSFVSPESVGSAAGLSVNALSFDAIFTSTAGMDNQSLNESQWCSMRFGLLITMVSVYSAYSGAACASACSSCLSVVPVRCMCPLHMSVAWLTVCRCSFGCGYCETICRLTSIAAGTV